MTIKNGLTTWNLALWRFALIWRLTGHSHLHSLRVCIKRGASSITVLIRILQNEGLSLQDNTWGNLVHF